MPALGWYLFRQDMLGPTDADQRVTTGANIHGGEPRRGGLVDGLRLPSQVSGSRSLVCPLVRSSSELATIKKPILILIMRLLFTEEAVCLTD